MAKDFKTFCKIMDFLDYKYPEMAKIYRGTCADLSLGSTKGKNGITLLIPSNEMFKEIKKLAYSADPNEANKACSILNAHILREALKPGMQIKEVSNSLFPSQIVKIVSLNDKTATLSNNGDRNKCEVAIESDFIDSSSRRNLAVWKITSGELAVTMDEPAPYMKKKKKAFGEKHGGYEIAGDPGIRTHISLFVENAYAMKCVQSLANNKQYVDPYINAVVSLAKYIYMYNRDMFFGCVLPLITYSRADFYFLIEPHNFGTSKLIPDNVINSWWNNQQGQSQNEIAQFYNKIPSLFSEGGHKYASCAIYSKRAELFNTIDIARKTVCNAIDSNPRDATVNTIKKIYSMLVDQNKVIGISDVLPSCLVDHYKANKGLCLIQDELRFVTDTLFNELESDLTFNSSHFEGILDIIAAGLYRKSSSDEPQAQLLNHQNILYNINASPAVKRIKEFVNSTYFLCIGCADKDSLKKASISSFYEENKTKLWDLVKRNFLKHKRLIVGDEEAKNKICAIAQKGLNDLTSEEKRFIINMYNKIQQQ